MPNRNVFMGSVGNDKYAKIIVEKADEIGLKTLFQVKHNASTATCAVLLTDQNRSLVAHLAAASQFTEDYLESNKIWSHIEHSRLFYITVGYFDHFV